MQYRIMVSSVIVAFCFNACAIIDHPINQSVVFVPQPIQTFRDLNPQGFYHTVEKGDTVWKVCRAYDIASEEVAESNRLPDQSHLEIGQMIFIPGKDVRTERLQAKKLIALLSVELKFQWPVRGEVINAFGVMVEGVRNKGIDIATTECTEIRASKSGVVAYANNSVEGKGNMIVLEHRGDFQTVYTYNAQNIIRKGQIVEQGQVIAYVGQTGSVKSATLHFELRKSTKPENPLDYLL